jgi:hypothetical protein
MSMKPAPGLKAVLAPKAVEPAQNPEDQSVAEEDGTEEKTITKQHPDTRALVNSIPFFHRGCYLGQGITFKS